EPKSWEPWNGRLYNTYRSNPRNYGVAPDLVVRAVQVTSPQVGCGALGDTISIIAQIANIGDLLVGGDIRVSFEGDFGSGFVPLLESAPMGGTRPLERPLGKSLDPRKELRIVIPSYDPSIQNESALPEKIRVVVDSEGQESECVEDNNSRELLVAQGGPQADLSVVIDDVSGCPNVDLQFTVTNNGVAASTAFDVGIYAGDPEQGGVLQTTIRVSDAIEPGESLSQQVDVRVPTDRRLFLYAVVDPENEVEECNDGNNRAAVGPITCTSGGVIVR
ncbi:MAG: hypothetical protein MK135_17515, partial [Polyangiaceae bacterium]|nr:hypothetical protein [Polyangiaceae bacterium]